MAMSEKQDVTTSKSEAAQDTRETEWTMRPLVDIFEDETGLTLQADMPGVSKERLDIQVDSDTLSINGSANIAMPEGMEPLYADVRSTRYERSFSLSRELDGGKVEATLKEGVLTLRIPKKEKYQPRKIEIRAG
jgi:HSP20 family molecular chaperone IbpA